MINLTRRIERLESAAGTDEGPTCIVVTDYPEEPPDAAVARYRAEHPETQTMPGSWSSSAASLVLRERWHERDHAAHPTAEARPGG
jgi:hypothetical protein